MDTISTDIIQSIATAQCDDIFKYLGRHQLSEGNVVVRTFLPAATQVEIIDPHQGTIVGQLQKHDTCDFFSAEVNAPANYRLRVTYGDQSIDIEDPYRFNTDIDPQDLYLYGEGTNERAYAFLGAHLREIEGVKGCRFAVWAPNAKRVSVVGSFNFWNGAAHTMRKHIPSGIWEIFIPDVEAGALYKYEILSAYGEVLEQKADPFGFHAQLPPEKASVVTNLNAYQWQACDWPEKRHQLTGIDKPISIYEVHLGSWKRKFDEGNRYLTYRELAAELIPYVQELGFTHLQLMPVSEFPFDGSWGYQPVGLYAPTSRFGSIDDFKFFVDQCHLAGIAVLMDWVPGHFPTDGHGLGRFDGTPLYEHADSRQGFHPDWNTYIFNYGRKEVANYLMANAIFWLEQYQIDGLRVDAVASMLYLDYSRKNGEWIANKYGGRENLEAIDFIRDTNERVYKNHPGVMMIAEESTAWPGVTAMTSSGGLGFSYKWNMGWMNDSLDYISRDPVHRKHHHNELTFSLYYAFSEQFILPISHDEVVHGKGSMIARMPGDTWQQFANLRAYYGYMWTHPGKKLLFMGCEFAQGPEWNHNESLMWHQLDTQEHAAVQRVVRDLNAIYRNYPALYEVDYAHTGFEWIEADDRHNSIFLYMRKSKDGLQTLICACNLTPVTREGYRIGVNAPGQYREIFNSDNSCYGGSHVCNETTIYTSKQSWQGHEHSIVVDIPPLATVIFAPEDVHD